MAVGWTGLEVLLVRKVFKMIDFIQGMFSEGTRLVVQGIMAVFGFYMAATLWRNWFLHDKKKKNQTGQK